MTLNIWLYPKTGVPQQCCTYVAYDCTYFTIYDLTLGHIPTKYATNGLLYDDNEADMVILFVPCKTESLVRWVARRLLLEWAPHNISDFSL